VSFPIDNLRHPRVCVVLNHCRALALKKILRETKTFGFGRIQNYLFITEYDRPVGHGFYGLGANF
jgi:hypothetical protein